VKQDAPEAAIHAEKIDDVLRRAAERGDISGSQLEWSIRRLAGNARRGNPRLGGRDRRQDILRAATTTFARRGYRHTTLEDIANELFMTKAGIYHYFSSKVAILEAIVEQAMVAAEDAVATGTAQRTTPTERLRRALRNYASVVLEQEAQSVSFSHFDELSSQVQAALNTRRKTIEAALRKVVEEGVALREFEVKDSHIAVFGILGAINWCCFWYDPGGRLSAEALVGELIERVLNGVVSRGPRSSVAPAPNHHLGGND
jgi:AcrR family transcriptional regulator